jgi:uncharacterized protein
VHGGFRGSALSTPQLLLLNFFLSWSGALAIELPSLLSGQAVSRTAGILIFPAMLFGPSISAMVLIWICDRNEGFRHLLARLLKLRVAARWFALLGVPPALVLLILFCLKRTVSAAFSPNHFYLGILFAVPAGIFEEIGWMGYAYPRMARKWNPLLSAVVLGLLWSLWHLPAINFLGAAAPHGAYRFRFFVAFAIAMTAMRVLICWQYSNTNSLLLAQLMHISSTATLVIFSPPVHPRQEALWYLVYGCGLWAIVGLIGAVQGSELGMNRGKSVARAC